MQCYKCKGDMKIFRDIMPKERVEYEGLECVKCGERIVTTPQLQSLASKYRKLRKAKEVTFSKWGNSLAVRIPSDIVNSYNLKDGKHGLITKDKNGIRIIPEV